mmetsp:Transcript_99175/g.256398  ORF Transcript_99175/g.256398 Transcript_99175/m.256398 type:complete len:239 (+) Transcript_99175:544-1260(+)
MDVAGRRLGYAHVHPDAGPGEDANGHAGHCGRARRLPGARLREPGRRRGRSSGRGAAALGLVGGRQRGRQGRRRSSGRHAGLVPDAVACASPQGAIGLQGGRDAPARRRGGADVAAIRGGAAAGPRPRPGAPRAVRPSAPDPLHGRPGRVAADGSRVVACIPGAGRAADCQPCAVHRRGTPDAVLLPGLHPGAHAGQRADALGQPRSERRERRWRSRLAASVRQVQGAGRRPPHGGLG